MGMIWDWMGLDRAGRRRVGLDVMGRHAAREGGWAGRYWARLGWAGLGGVGADGPIGLDGIGWDGKTGLSGRVGSGRVRSGWVGTNRNRMNRITMSHAGPG